MSRPHRTRAAVVLKASTPCPLYFVSQNVGETSHPEQISRSQRQAKFLFEINTWVLENGEVRPILTVERTGPGIKTGSAPGRVYPCRPLAF